jgi:hypothetical protein
MDRYKDLIRDEISKYLEEKSKKTVVNRAVDSVKTYARKGADRVVPEHVKRTFITAFESALGMINDASAYTYSMKDIYELFQKEGYSVNSIDEIRQLPFEVCDRVAQTHISTNKIYGAIEGGVTGSGGLFSMALDIPAIMAINFRMVFQIANSFGYSTDSEMEKLYILNIFSIADEGHVGKMMVWGELQKIAKSVAQKRVWSEIERNYLALAIKNVAEVLGVRLTKAKLGEMVPIIGLFVGAGINYKFTQSNGIAALMAYRQRRLDDEK